MDGWIDGWIDATTQTKTKTTTTNAQVRVGLHALAAHTVDGVHVDGRVVLAALQLQRLAVKELERHGEACQGLRLLRRDRKPHKKE